MPLLSVLTSVWKCVAFTVSLLKSFPVTSCNAKDIIGELAEMESSELAESINTSASNCQKLMLSMHIIKSYFATYLLPELFQKYPAAYILPEASLQIDSI